MRAPPICTRPSKAEALTQGSTTTPTVVCDVFLVSSIFVLFLISMHLRQIMTKAEAEKELQALRAEIERHNYHYYVLASPLISDFEFDQLMSRLLALERDFPDLVTPDSPSQRSVAASPKRFPSLRISGACSRSRTPTLCKNCESSMSA